MLPFHACSLLVYIVDQWQISQPYILLISKEICLIFLYLYGLSFNAAAVFNLSAPLVVHEQDLRFNVTISLVEPSGGISIPIEIIIMETKITAIPSSKYV